MSHERKTGFTDQLLINGCSNSMYFASYLLWFFTVVLGGGLFLL